MRNAIVRLRWAFLALLLALLGSSAARAHEFYYVLIFGSQDHPKHLRNTHTWATFVRAVGEGPDASAYTLTYHTISWYPASRVVKVWRPFPEQGVNLSLEESLAEVTNNGESVTLWGPFRIEPQLYERSLMVYDLAESGRPQYRAISSRTDLLIADCIHAVAAVDPKFGRGHYPLLRIGKPASRYLARQVMMRSVYDQWQNDNDWLVPRLGLDRWRIEVVPATIIPKRGCVLCLCPD
jgi:hypothetical protein